MTEHSYLQTGSASWPKETVRERIQTIPEVIDLLGGFDRVRFRLTLEYDPALPRAPFLMEYGVSQSADTDSQPGKVER